MRRRQSLDNRRSDARPEFETWLASARPEDVVNQIPTSDLEVWAPLDDGGSRLRYQIRGKLASAKRPGTVEWRPGRISAKAAYLNQGAALKLEDVGDFEANQAFSYSAWVKLPANDGSGAILAHIKESSDYRGWDFWVEGRRVGTHIINKWPDTAIKVVTHDQLPADEWVHVAVTYDGSRKAAGVQLYVNGQLQAANVLADSLSGTIRVDTKLTIGQRRESALLSGATIQDVRIYAHNFRKAR